MRYMTLGKAFDLSEPPGGAGRLHVGPSDTVGCSRGHSWPSFYPGSSGSSLHSDPFFLDVTGHLFIPRQRTPFDQELMSVVLAHNKASRSWLNSMRQVVNLAFQPFRAFLLQTVRSQREQAAHSVVRLIQGSVVRPAGHLRLFAPRTLDCNSDRWRANPSSCSADYF